MPNRVIRDGLLDSESVSGLHDKTFRLYVYLLLSADCYGLVATDYAPIRRMTPLLDWSRELVAKMLGELTDAGLIFPYEVSEKRFAAMARWESAVFTAKPKHPPPPFGWQHIRAGTWFKTPQIREQFERTVFGNINKINAPATESMSPVTNQSITGTSLVAEGVKGLRGLGVKGNGENQERSKSKTTTAPSAPTRASAPGVFLEIPAWVPAGPWEAWIDMRKRIRKPPTPSALKLAIGKLERLRTLGHDPTAVLNQSILGGWTGLYEEQAAPRRKPQTVEDVLKEIADRDEN